MYNMPERPKWTEKCPNCGSVVSPAFGKHLGDQCPFCQKILQNKKIEPNRGYGRRLF